MRGGSGRWVALIGLAACSFDSSGVGAGSGLEESSGSTSASVTDATSTSAADTSTTSGDADASTSVDPPDDDTSTAAADPAVLEISGAPSLAYGDVEIATSASSLLTLSHVSGDAAATNLSWALAGAFAFTGAGFPGAAGDCSAQLEPGESCSLELAFHPTAPGPTDGLLTIHYFDGATDQSASRILAGAGVGYGENLVSNGAGELCAGDGMAPLGWEPLAAGWVCHCPPPDQGVQPHSGSCALYGNTPSDNEGTFEMRQDIDVTAYGDAIAEGNFGFEFRGWGTRRSDYRRYRMEVVYLDANAAVLDAWSTGNQAHTTWQEHVDRRAAPADTHTISVRLFTYKDWLGTHCQAYFDDIQLRAVYPAAP